MLNKKIKKYVAMLESQLDQLETELSYLNQLLVTCGFAEGIKTLKTAAEEIIVADALPQTKFS